MELLVWGLGRYEILIVLKKVVPPYTAVNSIGQLHFSLLSLSILQLSRYEGSAQGVPFEFGFFWLLVNLNIFICLLNICVSSLSFLSFVHFECWIVLSFSYWCVEGISLCASMTLEKTLTLRVTNWHFTAVCVSHRHWFLNFYVWKQRCNFTSHSGLAPWIQSVLPWTSAPKGSSTNGNYTHLFAYIEESAVFWEKDPQLLWDSQKVLSHTRLSYKCRGEERFLFLQSCTYPNE